MPSGLTLYLWDIILTMNILSVILFLILLAISYTKNDHVAKIIPESKIPFVLYYALEREKVKKSTFQVHIDKLKQTKLSENTHKPVNYGSSLNDISTIINKN